MNVLTDLADLDGHDQLAALMAANRHPPIGETLEFALVELERGRVVSRDHRLARSTIQSDRCMAAMRRPCSTALADVRSIPTCRQVRAIRLWN